MKREFKVTFSSLEEAWFDNEAIVIAETEEQAFNLVKDCIDSGKNPFTVFNSKQCEVIENVHTKDYEIADGLNEIPYKDSVQENIVNIVSDDRIIDEFVETRKTNLNPKYTFDNFVVGDTNRFAFSSCLQVAQNPGKL